VQTTRFLYKIRQISSEISYLFLIEPTSDTPKKEARVFKQNKYETPAFG